MRDHASVVIIGAGIVGCSVAYHLSRLGVTDVVVVEQGPLFETGGSTSHAPGLIFQVNPSRAMTELAKYSVDLYSRLEGDGAPCFYPVGGLEAAWTKERFEDFKRRRGLALSYGIDAELIGPSEVRELVPIVSERVVGALHVPSDGIGKAVRAAEAMAREAQASGVVFHADTRVTDIEVSEGRVRAVVTDRGRIRTDLLVCAAGIWGPKVGRMAGVSIPLYPMQHQYARIGPLAELKGQTGEASHPIMRHQDRALYLRQHGDSYGIGSADHEPLPVEPEDIVGHGEPGVMPAAMAFTASDFAPARRSAEEFIPALEGAELVEGFNGMFSFTPDAMPVLGESDEVRGFWAAEAVWIAHAGGAGRAIAEWIVDGSPSIDLRECDITRFHPHARTRPYALVRSLEGSSSTERGRRSITPSTRCTAREACGPAPSMRGRRRWGLSSSRAPDGRYPSGTRPTSRCWTAAMSRGRTARAGRRATGRPSLGPSTGGRASGRRSSTSRRSPSWR